MKGIKALLNGAFVSIFVLAANSSWAVTTTVGEDDVSKPIVDFLQTYVFNGGVAFIFCSICFVWGVYAFVQGQYKQLLVAFIAIVLYNSVNFILGTFGMII